MKAIIVDTNAIHRLFSGENVGSKIWELMMNRSLQVPGGGTKFREEILKSPLVSLYQELLRSGIIKLYDDQEIDGIAQGYEANPHVTSDDHHVIAIANRSGCRVLFSNDKALSDDFKNPNIINNPRGKIINRKYYPKIVQDATCCRN